MFRGVEELASPESLLKQAVSGAEVLGVELGAVSHDGGVTHLYGSAAPLLDKQGSPRGAVAVFVDVTELKLAYARMAAQVQELARSNSELERFASTISHDLRSPLMSMSGCAQLILERHMESLSPTGRALIGNIQTCAREMDLLIKCLRDYARAGHGELRLTQCDANSALHSALSNLQADLNRAEAEVTADTLPTVRADESLLAQLLQNLIENAIKYAGTTASRIHVSVRDEPGHWIFSVSDNGIGIDPQDFDRIFQAFERLHAGESQYSGLGIGLAICKRIAERHGGRIWVESQPGSGTTFFFSLAR
jgi:signal transduction histidine kinase